MLAMVSKTKRGDTLIEVLFAVSVFSLVAVCSLSIMNQGVATAQRALEITLVRQEIDSQAETLRFLNESYTAGYQSGTEYSNYYGDDTKDNTPAGQWARMMETLDSRGREGDSVKASPFGVDLDNKCPNPPSGSFIMNTISAQYSIFGSPANIYEPAITFAQVRYTSDNLDKAQGIWIEAVHRTSFTNAEQSNTGYVDFHIRACWDNPGQAVPLTLGTIVRLYEPRG